LGTGIAAEDSLLLPRGRGNYQREVKCLQKGKKKKTREGGRVRLVVWAIFGAEKAKGLVQKRKNQKGKRLFPISVVSAIKNSQRSRSRKAEKKRLVGWVASPFRNVEEGRGVNFVFCRMPSHRLLPNHERGKWESSPQSRVISDPRWREEKSYPSLESFSLTLQSQKKMVERESRGMARQ